ncbi:hypothetical protein niasHT_010921 [Heterodera trifolii]|uniref:DUF7083 domain-containing protein n=1 Tax=Heterodera trifolii TaxID=157864 RepID=A0ABD2LFW6_9BILA
MTAPIQAIVKGCASKLEALLGTEMPPDLGVNALPNQCQRRLYKFRNLLNHLEKVIKKIDENLGLANDYIGKLSRDNAARKETEMQELLQELNIIDKQRTHTADGDTTSGIVPLSGSVPMRKNLPKTELKRFDGSPSQWIPLWDYFRTIIHEDSHVPKIEKFSYLDLCIEGKASAIIQGIPISESGYDDAIDLLLKTYGETKRLIRTLNRELMSLQISESFEDDESLYLKSEKIFRQLISMNQNVEDGMYYSNLEGKMSPEVLDKYCVIKDIEDNDDWDTSKFRNAFSRVLDQIKHRQELRKNVLKPKREHHEQTMSFTATKQENNQERNKSSQNKSDQSPHHRREEQTRKFQNRMPSSINPLTDDLSMKDDLNSPEIIKRRDVGNIPMLSQGGIREGIGRVNAVLNITGVKFANELDITSHCVEELIHPSVIYLDQKEILLKTRKTNRLKKTSQSLKRSISDWLERFNFSLDCAAPQLADQAKVKLLMTKLSEAAFSQYSKSCLPKKVTDFDFSQTEERLKIAFSRPQSIWIDRYECLRASKSDDENFRPLINNRSRLPTLVANGRCCRS